MVLLIQNIYIVFGALQAIVGILRKEASVIDPGTYTSNAVITENSNARKDVESENHNQIREFFTTETDAFLVSAAMHYFGLEGVDSVPTKNVFPPNFHQSSFEDKRKWLCEHVGHLFDQYVSDSVTDWGDSLESEAVSEHQAVSREEFRCRFSGCSRVFLYAKCRTNHEKSKHGLVVDDIFEPDVIAETTPQDVLSDTVQPSPSESLAPFAAPEKTPEGDMGTIVKEDMKKEDHIFNYGCLHISLGLLIRDAEDSVKEGDGERSIRVWKFLTYLFLLRGCHKYALAGLRILASMEGLL